MQPSASYPRGARRAGCLRSLPSRAQARQILSPRPRLGGETWRGLRAAVRSKIPRFTYNINRLAARASKKMCVTLRSAKKSALIAFAGSVPAGVGQLHAPRFMTDRKTRLDDTRDDVGGGASRGGGGKMFAAWPRGFLKHECLVSSIHLCTIPTWNKKRQIVP